MYWYSEITPKKLIRQGENMPRAWLFGANGGCRGCGQHVPVNNIDMCQFCMSWPNILVNKDLQIEEEVYKEESND